MRQCPIGHQTGYVLLARWFTSIVLAQAPRIVLILVAHVTRSKFEFTTILLTRHLALHTLSAWRPYLDRELLHPAACTDLYPKTQKHLRIHRTGRNTL